MRFLKNIKYFAISDIGLKRKLNEDYYAIYKSLALNPFYGNGGLLFVVADGIGGNPCGDVASKMACQELNQFCKNTLSLSVAKQYANQLETLIYSIDQRLRDQAVLQPECEHMGTTLSTLTLTEKYAVTENVGDSRIYRLRDNHLVQLTVDHTFVNEMIEEGELGKDALVNHPLRHMITQAVGTMEPLEKVEKRILDVALGDTFLLSSDGLHDQVAFGDIEYTLKSQKDPEKTTEILVQTALENGGNDNITLIVVRL